jgi:hypothetical protein
MYIRCVKGRWLLDGKKLSEMTQDEKNQIDDFFREYKATAEVFKIIDRIESERKPRLMQFV